MDTPPPQSDSPADPIPPPPPWLRPSDALAIDEFIDEPLEIEAFGDSLELTDFVSSDAFGVMQPFPNPLRHPLQMLGWLIRNGFGVMSLLLLLAIVAAIPIVNLLALGFLLEAQARVIRTGKIRHGFPLIALAPRIGMIAVGIGVWMLPVWLLGSHAADAQLIDPAGGSAASLPVVTFLVSTLIATHLCLGLARGGTFGCFIRPIKNVRWMIGQIRGGGYFERAERHLIGFMTALRLKHHFMLGLRGFVGAFAWLVIPTALFAAVRTSGGPQVLITILGGLLLLITFAWVPFLQARFAVEDRLSAMFELRAVRQLFCRAPIAWLVAVFVVFVMAVPPYLLKAFDYSSDARWLGTLVFIATIYPGRIVTGWAYGRAVRKQQNAWFGSRWLSRTIMLPLLLVYVVLLFLTQFVGTQGRAELFFHHAFLLPVPF
ncbi:MAG: hypothetical protein O3A00_28290 [Planctomycetota bacterium]|nr:hypothetical protein [Planctomycetota bacterium]